MLSFCHSDCFVLQALSNQAIHLFLTRPGWLWHGITLRSWGPGSPWWLSGEHPDRVWTTRQDLSRLDFSLVEPLSYPQTHFPKPPNITPQVCVCLPAAQVQQHGLLPGWTVPLWILRGGGSEIHKHIIFFILNCDCPFVTMYESQNEQNELTRLFCYE